MQGFGKRWRRGAWEETQHDRSGHSVAAVIKEQMKRY